MSSRWIVVVVLGALPGSAGTAQQVAPAHGALVAVGGALRDTAILRTFLDLAGGVEAPIVLVPTAGGDDHYDQNWSGRSAFEALGATHLTVVHTRDTAVANEDAFVAPLREARGVWFGGGRQWRLADAYLGTRFRDLLDSVLARGGVIGGTSAGATILGSYLVRGDTRTNTIMMGDHEDGFGLLRNVAIDQHLLRRNRHFDLIEVIEARPALLGIGLDENTAIVVRGDGFEVIGQSYVAVYDHDRTLDTGGRFYFLAPGDRYDLASRTPLRAMRRWEPLERVRPVPWP